MDVTPTEILSNAAQGVVLIPWLPTAFGNQYS